MKWLTADWKTFLDPVSAHIGLALAAVFCGALIGMERQRQEKAAGLRTLVMVCLGSAGFTMAGYAFTTSTGDSGRVAAQIVTGIGFIGGGLIFVRSDAVQGLTTAAIVWITAAIGMACGAGLPLLALVVTAAHFTVVFLFPYLEVRLPRSRYLGTGLRVVYADGRGLLRQILDESARLGFAVVRLDTRQLEHDVHGTPAVAVNLMVQGQPTPESLAAALHDLDGIFEVTATTDLTHSAA
jgi:putative Mg2+ transporter-C (MgtC) family protein